MSSNTGIIYGKVKHRNIPTPGFSVDLDWVQREDSATLTIGGNDDLNKPVPRCTTTMDGEYVIPFFWEPAQVPGNFATANAAYFFKDNSRISKHAIGNVGIGIDVRRLIGIPFPEYPPDKADATRIFIDFWIAASSTLKGLSIAKRFADSAKINSAECQGLFCRIDFQF